MNQLAVFDLAVFIGLNVFLLTHMLWCGFRKPPHPIRNPIEPKGEEMRPFLYLKMFYINPQDPRGFPPKIKASMGWTVNFRTHIHAQIFGVTLVLIIISSMLMLINVCSQASS